MRFDYIRFNCWAESIFFRGFNSKLTVISTGICFELLKEQKSLSYISKKKNKKYLRSLNFRNADLMWPCDWVFIFFVNAKCNKNIPILCQISLKLDVEWVFIFWGAILVTTNELFNLYNINLWCFFWVFFCGCFFFRFICLILTVYLCTLSLTIFIVNEDVQFGKVHWCEQCLTFCNTYTFWWTVNVLKTTISI